MDRMSRLPLGNPRPRNAPLALQGIRVVDFSRVIAGPLCTQILGDMGAEIIKIENPQTGDETRNFQHPSVNGLASSFLAFNRNKKSIALDITNPEGSAIARDLIRTADVVVENFSTGVMARHGLDYPTVSVVQPELIYCSIGAYGREGEFADRPGYDPVIQAESGVMAMNGLPDGEPVRTNLPFIDQSTGMLAANAILAALFARTHTGVGQYVETALFDVAITLTTYFGLNYLISGVDQTRYGHAPRGVVPIGLFQASDGAFYMSVGNDRLFRRLATKGIGSPDLADDPRFSTNAERVRNRVELFALLNDAFGSDSRDNWIRRLRNAGVPVGPVRTIGETFESAEMQARHLVSKIEHPNGPLPTVAPPFRLSGTPIVDPTPPPMLGEHTHQILQDLLQLDEVKIAALRTKGAFG